MSKPFFSQAVRLVTLVCATWTLAVHAQADEERPRLDRAPRAASGAMLPASTDRLIIHYKDADTRTAPPDARVQQARSTGGRFGLSVSHQRRMSTGADVFQLGRRLGAADMQALMTEMQRADSNIDHIEPDIRLHPQARVADPYLARQWSLYDFDTGMWAAYAWSYARGANVVVAVVDTGVLPHPDLQGNLLAGHDFISDTHTSNDGDGRDPDASDPGDWVDAEFCGAGTGAASSGWHGTHVAGIVAATGYNGLGVTGVAYNARILPVRAMGRCGGYLSDIADGIYWAAGGSVAGVPANTTPARVINLSMGAPEACLATMQTAINRARALGAVVVAAAGNEAGEAASSVPANCAGVVSVAATNRSGGRASYSNFGSTVTLAAPGGDNDAGIWSTLNDGLTGPGNATYATYMGTSMAAPHVSGALALMLSANKNLLPDRAASLLVDTSMDFVAPCEGCGVGLINAMDAVQAALDAVISLNEVAEVEANNTLGTAQAVPLTPARISGGLSTTTDVDYYKFSVVAGSRIVGTLSAASAMNYDLYAYDAFGRQLSFSVNGAGVNDVVTFSNTGSTMTTVYLRVVRNTGEAGAYTLSVSH